MNPGTPAQPSDVPRPHGGHHRPHLFPGRQQRVHVRFTDDEYAELASAAGQAGLTPTGFCAQAALDTARDLHAEAAEQAQLHALAGLQAELFGVRVALNQIRVELGMFVTADVGCDTQPARDNVIAHATNSLTHLDEAISGIHRQLARRPPPSTPTAPASGSPDVHPLHGEITPRSTSCDGRESVRQPQPDEPG